MTANGFLSGLLSLLVGLNICMVINQLLHDNKPSLIIYSNPLFYPLIYSKTLFSFSPAIFPFVQFSGCLV